MRNIFKRGISALRKTKRSLKANGLKTTLKKVKHRLVGRKIDVKATICYFNPAEIENIPLPKDIKFSVIVPLYNTNEQYLKEMIDSVLNQTYPNLELCLADGSDENHKYVAEVCQEYAKNDNRVVYKHLEHNGGISANSNACVDMATGDYIALLDHDDLYDIHALYQNAKTIKFTNADVVYSDEDHLTMDGKHMRAYYKPDFSIDLLRSHMYICHLLVIRRSLFYKVGGFDSKFDGSQDYDLMLRLTEVTDKIAHIPMTLYTWRECETSTAGNAEAKPYAHIAGKGALDAHLKRVYGDGARAEESGYTFVFDARYNLPLDTKISIIMPMKDKYQLTENCINSIIEKSSFNNYEILIVDNNTTEEKSLTWLKNAEKIDSRIKVIKADMEFNWSKINNYATKFATGNVYVFLNNDTKIITTDWLERLAENALRKDMGAVGAVLLYEDNTIQHAGVVVGMGGWADHMFKGFDYYHWFHNTGSPAVSRNVSAVTGACLAVSKEHFNLVGGFDESFIVCGSDVKFGLDCIKHGLVNKCLGTVSLYHLESKSRNPNAIPEVDFCRSFECYKNYNGGIDPYYNVNIDLYSPIGALKSTPESIEVLKEYIKNFPLNTQIYKKNIKE